MARLAMILISVAMATGMFVIKTEVISLEKKLEQINARIKEDQETLHVLKAQWADLNDPKRIRTLSSRLVQMKPVRGEQIISFSAIPFKTESAENENIIRVSFASAKKE